MAGAIPPHSFHEKGPSLAAVVGGSSTWERTILPIDPAFRVLLGTVTATQVALVAAGVLGPGLIASIGRSDGFYLFGQGWYVALAGVVLKLLPAYIAVAAALIAASVVTAAFAEAGRRLQIGLAVLATAGALAASPALGLALIALANLVTWIALVIAGIGLALAVLAAVLDS